MEEILIDSGLTRDEALADSLAPSDVLDALALIDIRYVSFDDRIHQGQLVVHQDLAREVAEIFDELLALRFPILKAVPISAYGWDDLASMRDNNTSAFNYRVIFDTDQISNHSLGRAVDINPLTNPYTTLHRGVLPENSLYDPAARGTFTTGSSAVQAFTTRGWKWLGERDLPDWQHFEKPQ